MHKKIVALCGSIRQGSSNHHILEEVSGFLPGFISFEIYEGIKDLPFFDPNADDDHITPAVKEFREKIQSADGVLICTPEYVFSIPAVLKNALEWTVSTMVFADKPTAIITASSLGDKCHDSLQLVMKTIGARFDEHTLLLINNVRSKLDGHGHIADPEVKASVKLLANALVDMC